MVSVASPGEVLPNAADLGVASFGRLGRIEVSHSSSERPRVDPLLPPNVAGNVIGNVDASGEGGGRIFIRSGELVAESAFIFADTRGRGEGQGIDMRITGQVTARNGALITADTLGSGSGGDLTVEGGSLEVREDADISASTFGSGQGGNLLVEARSLEMLGGAQIIAGTFGSGQGGNLLVEAESLEMLGGAQIIAGTFGSGQGGNLLVEADRVLLSGIRGAFASGLFASTIPGSSGDAGDLTVRVGSLEVREGAQISTSTFGSGDGGELLVEAGNILLAGSSTSGFSSGLFTDAIPGSSGDAGDLTVRAGSLEMREGALISARTRSTGRGGDLTITATDIVLGDKGAISALSTITGLDTENNPEVGRSGSISITARDTFRLFNGGQVSVETAQANAGNIILNVGTLLHLRDQSSITTSVAGGQGDGGNISIDPVFTVLDGGSRIIARARQGRGGNIRIVSDFLFVSPESLIDASSELGVSGVVDVESPETDVVSGALALPESFLDAASLLSDRCTARAIKGASSFIVSGRGGVPSGPETVLPSFPELGLHEAPKAKGSARVSENALAQGSTPIDCAIE